MEIKDQTITTDIDAQGNEIVSEIEATYTETLSDGTEVSAEITTTADADDPTQIEGHMTVTETALDGTETVTEATTNADGTMTVEEVEDKSFTEEVYEALFDTEAGDDDDILTDEDSENADFEVADSDTEFESVEFTDGDEAFESTDLPAETPVMDAPFDATYQTADSTFVETPIVDTSSDTFGTVETDNSEIEEAEAAEIAAQEAHAQAATDAQQSADEFIASGDYNAAAEARETAENESWEAGDDSMLSAYDAQDLTTAADKQEDAAYYEAREAEHAQQGDYAAAKEDAGNAAYAVGDADYYAGGDDHTGQAKAEEYNMDIAVWHEGIADDAADNAVYYAEQGNLDAAESSAGYAAEQQGMADHFGDLGEHGGDMAVYDPSSEVDTGGTYDSSFDSTAVDTGFDSGMDTSMDSGYDSGTDDI